MIFQGGPARVSAPSTGRTEKIWVRFWKQVSQLQLPAVSGWAQPGGLCLISCSWNENRLFANIHPGYKLTLSLQLLFCSAGGTERMQESLAGKAGRRSLCRMVCPGCCHCPECRAVTLRGKKGWNNTCYNHCKMFKAAWMQHREKHNLEDAISRMCPSLICAL